jgi:hypothetical protein
MEFSGVTFNKWGQIKLSMQSGDRALSIDQSGGTGDTYGVLGGAINGSNTTFTVSQGVYISGKLTVYLNGQIQTQGTSEDWTETAPASGTFDFATAPTGGDEITVAYYTSTTTLTHTHDRLVSPDGLTDPVISTDNDGDLTTVGNALIGGDLTTVGDVLIPDGEDVYPNDDGAGIAKRFINSFGLTTWDAHFRTGDTAGSGELTGYSWQGAPFATPSSVTYSLSNDYLSAYQTVAAQRSFLAKSITNSAAAWQGKGIYARINTGVTTELGVRYDGNDDNNYVELFAEGGLNDGTYRIDFRYRDNGGAVNTVTSNIIIPCSQFVTVYLLCYYSSPNYTAYAYILTEIGSTINITGFNHVLTGNWTTNPPLAGRAGLIVNELGNRGSWDWIYNTFG